MCKDCVARQPDDCPVQSKQKPADVFPITSTWPEQQTSVSLASLHSFGCIFHQPHVATASIKPKILIYVVDQQTIILEVILPQISNESI